MAVNPSDSDRFERFVISRRLLLGALGFGLAATTLLDDRTPASAIGGYLRPCGDVRILDSWQGHKNRNPPSQEPGTDYAVSTGTPVRAVTDGTVDSVKTTTSGATGRFVGMRHADGAYTRHLHLQSISVATGTQVTRGQTIAYSGGSANGSESGVAAHVHTSMWLGSTDPVSNTVDFENYVGAQLAGEDDMFTEEDRAMLRNVYAAIFAGGPSMDDEGRSIAFSLANLTEFAARIDANVAPIARLVNGQLTQISLRQEVADAKTNTLELLNRTAP